MKIVRNLFVWLKSRSCVRNAYGRTLPIIIGISVKAARTLTRQLLIFKNLNPDVSPQDLLTNNMLSCLNHIVDNKREFRENELYDFNWAKMKFEELKKHKNISEEEFHKYTNITYFDSPYVEKMKPIEPIHKSYYVEELVMQEQKQETIHDTYYMETFNASSYEESSDHTPKTSDISLSNERSSISAIVSGLEQSSQKTASKILSDKKLNNQKPMICNFDVGDNIRVIDGALAGFYGVVKKIKPDSRQLIIKTSVLGKEMLVLINFIQAELCSGEFEEVPDTKNSHQLMWK